MVKLYGGKMSSAGRCHMLLKEIGLKYEEAKLDMKAKEHKAPAFLKLNPNGKIPCLQDGSFILWESMAINNYLAAKYKPDMLGKSPEDKALIDQWSYWAILEVQPTIFKVLGYSEHKPETDREKKDLNDAQELLVKTFGIMNDHMKDREFILGKTYSLADINVGSIFSLGDFIKLDFSKYPNVSKWLDNLKQKPAFKQ